MQVPSAPCSATLDSTHVICLEPTIIPHPRFGAHPGELARENDSVTRSKAFNVWFRSSKVTMAGEPRIVWHGTKDVFRAFDMSKARDGAHFFSASLNHAAWFGHARAFYVRIENPFVISQVELETRWDERVNDGGESGVLPRDMVESFVLEAKAAKHDGLIVREMADLDLQADVFLPFTPEQIKSAFSNRGSFDLRNPDYEF